ncbi:MAG: electron transfer flavoprotein beta subunit/FixA family protein, partial [Bacteroidetes bacterium]|nr:electron transfer flavoprotein beta subunit/FixA family protein [Bacteroidota bacterium]
VGPASVEAVMRKALAIGADDAVRINMEPGDAYSTAKVISDYASGKGYDLILCGKETIDYNGSEVGGMIAGMLDLPFVSLATSLNVNGSNAVAEIDIENGTEEITVAMPVVISAAKGMAEARIPNMRGIMAARTKQIEVIEASEASLVEVKKFSLPAPKSAVKLIAPENVDQLVELLHSEAKVI